MAALIFTGYCRGRMALRGITEADEEEALAQAIYTRASHTYRVEWYGEVSGRLLKVAVAADTDPPVVVNVMPMERRRVDRLIERSRQ